MIPERSITEDIERRENPWALAGIDRNALAELRSFSTYEFSEELANSLLRLQAQYLHPDLVGVDNSDQHYLEQVLKALAALRDAQFGQQRLEDFIQEDRKPIALQEELDVVNAHYGELPKARTLNSEIQKFIDLAGSRIWRAAKNEAGLLDIMNVAEDFNNYLQSFGPFTLRICRPQKFKDISAKFFNELSYDIEEKKDAIAVRKDPATTANCARNHYLGSLIRIAEISDRSDYFRKSFSSEPDFNSSINKIFTKYVEVEQELSEIEVLEGIEAAPLYAPFLHESESYIKLDLAFRRFLVEAESESVKNIFLELSKQVYPLNMAAFFQENSLDFKTLGLLNCFLIRAASPDRWKNFLTKHAKTLEKFVLATDNIESHRQTLMFETVAVLEPHDFFQALIKTEIFSAQFSYDSGAIRKKRRVQPGTVGENLDTFFNHYEDTEFACYQHLVGVKDDPKDTIKKYTTKKLEQDYPALLNKLSKKFMLCSIGGLPTLIDVVTGNRFLAMGLATIGNEATKDFNKGKYNFFLRRHDYDFPHYLPRSLNLTVPESASFDQLSVIYALNPNASDLAQDIYNVTQPFGIITNIKR